MSETLVSKRDPTSKAAAQELPRLRIGVVVDWNRSPRGEHWTRVLRDLDDRGHLPNQATGYPIGQLVVGQPRLGDPGHTGDIRHEKVLIINWDAVNGDPEYGAHLALRWFEHRGRELIDWVRRGGILIVEGQAVFGVPCQQAYDAIAGAGELPVCGSEKPDNPMQQKKRWGFACRKTRWFPDSGGFEEVRDRMEVSGSPTYDTYFPPYTDRLIGRGALAAEPWDRKLYRGWFRRFARRASLPWVPIIETADHRWPFNLPTMKVARLDRGAIFVSTMFLATTRQIPLIVAMLRCADGHVDHLPKPNRPLEAAQKYWKGLLTFGVVLLGTHAIDPLRHAVEAMSVVLSAQIPVVSDATLTGVVRVVVPTAGAFLLEGMAGAYGRARRVARRALGY